TSRTNLTVQNNALRVFGLNLQAEAFQNVYSETIIVEKEQFSLLCRAEVVMHESRNLHHLKALFTQRGTAMCPVKDDEFTVLALRDNKRPDRFDVELRAQLRNTS